MFIAVQNDEAVDAAVTKSGRALHIATRSHPVSHDVSPGRMTNVRTTAGVDARHMIHILTDSANLSTHRAEVSDCRPDSVTYVSNGFSRDMLVLEITVTFTGRRPALVSSGIYLHVRLINIS